MRGAVRRRAIVGAEHAFPMRSRPAHADPNIVAVTRVEGECAAVKRPRWVALAVGELRHENVSSSTVDVRDEDRVTVVPDDRGVPHTAGRARGCCALEMIRPLQELRRCKRGRDQHAREKGPHFGGVIARSDVGVKSGSAGRASSRCSLAKSRLTSRILFDQRVLAGLNPPRRRRSSSLPDAFAPPARLA